MKIRRTLLTAGVFALLAMIYVPTPAKPYHAAHYRFVFSQDDTSVAFFQLLVNVVFAALLGAILAAIIPKLPRWAWRWITGIAVIALLCIGGVAWRNFTAAAADRARFDEEFADSQLAYHYPDAAKFTLRNAALNWRLALRFDEATRVENKIKELQQHPAQDWHNDPVVDLSGLPDQAPAQAPQASGQLAPRGSRPAAEQFPLKTNIVTTVFWIGEPQSSENPKAHVKSAWDANWTANYGGVDSPDPSARRSYIPIAFIPRQNPFYCALPYNDVTHDQFKPEAPLVIPWFKQAYTGPGQSVCWHRWLAIRKGNRTCYAEWEDCGPFVTDHFQYVFGNERPKPNLNHGAGLDVSPAVRDYLGLAPTDVIDWQFVEVRDVPPGPWRSYGENNHFVIARRQNEQRMEQNSRQNDQGPKN